jgi:uncharacterized membrane protein
MKQSWRPSIDTIILLILGTASVASVTDALGAWMVLLVGCYVLLDIAAGADRLQTVANRLYKAKLTLVMLAVALAVLFPAASMIVMRQSTGPERYIQDGALQTELALQYLLEGKNPYTEDYRDTPLADWEWDSAREGVAENPALYHNVYLPFTFLFSLPFYAVLRQVTGWYDQRIVYLLLFFCAFWPVVRHAAQRERKLGLLILFGLNFFIAPYTAWGGNDSLVLFCVAMSSYLLMQDRLGLSALSLGLACASKHTAWFFVPFFLTYVWIQAPAGDRIPVIRKIYPLLVVPLLVILPFVLWDASAFLDDTVLYMSGSAAVSYPIRGLGIGSLLLALGVIGDKTAYFPFSLLQLVFCLPLLVFLLRRQVSSNTVRQCWLGYGLLLLTFGFFSRFLNHTLLGVAITALGMGLLAEEGAKETLE